jgi:hypothetical protein
MVCVDNAAVLSCEEVIVREISYNSVTYSS